MTSTTSSGDYVPCFVDPDASENDVDSDDDFEPIPKKKRGTQKIYSLVKRFETTEEAEKELKSDGNKWSKRNRYNLCDGRKQFYTCTTIPHCPAMSYLYWLDEGGVSLFRSTDEHQHQQVNSSSGLPHKTKEAINQLIADGVNKPNAILQSLSSRGIEPLTKAQLKNYLARYRLKKFGAGTIQ